MGIPSYFRKLASTYRIVLPQLPVKPGILCFDFNCLIYRCLYSPTLRPFPGADPYEAETWEGELLTEVVHTVKEVWAAAGSPKHVYIAVDGVVPMAKIRQQRVRRFKSAWLDSQKAIRGWDKNAITPGTAFMDKLTVALQALVKKQGAKWVLSSVQEPGEGEHKLLAYLRKNRNLCDAPIVIYGLDADLILLSMLLSEEVSQSVWLLRERQEFERTDSDTTEYSFLDVNTLKEKVHVTDWISCINYVALMSLMGNDFIPHSLTHKLSDDGHSHILKELLAMKGSDAWLVDSGGSLNLSVVKAIASRWATEETERMYDMIQKKQKQAQRGVLQGMDPSEGLPLQWNVEQEMLQGKRLKDTWRDVYWGWMHPSVDRASVVNEYVKGVQWVITYYLGQSAKTLDTDWIFPYWIPPLWSDIARVSCLPGLALVSPTTPPSPSEQLSMVLPLQSWGLVRDPALRKLPLLCPQAWPASFSFFSAGRRWLWECEALIPVLTAGRIRDLLSFER
jgi:5'-3' exonuclease